MSKGIRFKVDSQTLCRLYKSLVRPVMEYADVIWSGCTDTESDHFEHADVQYEAAKVVTGAIKGTSRQRLLEELGWESIKTRRIIHRIVLFYKIVNNYCPAFLLDLLPSQVFQRTHYSLCSSINFSVFATRTERFRNSVFPSVIALWNQLKYRNTKYRVNRVF